MSTTLQDKAKWLASTFGTDSTSDWMSEAKFLRKLVGKKGDSDMAMLQALAKGKSRTVSAASGRTSRSRSANTARPHPPTSQPRRAARRRDKVPNSSYPNGSQTARGGGGGGGGGGLNINTNTADSLDKFSESMGRAVHSRASSTSPKEKEITYNARPEATVNGLLRDKMSQNGETQLLLDKKLKACRRQVQLVSETLGDLLHLCDSKLHGTIALCDKRIELRRSMPGLQLNSDMASLENSATPDTHVQLAVFVAKHDSGGEELEEVMSQERAVLVQSVQTVENMIKYGDELSLQLEQVERQLHNYLVYTTYTLKTDRHCLSINRKSGGAKPPNKESALPVKVDELIPLPQVLEIGEWTLNAAVMYVKQGRECLEVESKRLRELQMRTVLAMRTLMRESYNLKKEIKDAIMLLNNQLPMLTTKEAELRKMLQQQLGPLEVCQRRYQVRIQREGANQIDEVQEALRDQLNKVGQNVNCLQEDLQNVANLIQANHDKRALLTTYLKIQNDHLALHENLIKFNDAINKAKRKPMKKGAARTNRPTIPSQPHLITHNRQQTQALLHAPPDSMD